MVATTARPAGTTGAAVTYGRSLKGWYQEDLARELAETTGNSAWDKRRVSRVERGDYEPRGSEIVALSSVLGLPPQFLLYGLDGSDSVGGRTVPGLSGLLNNHPDLPHGPEWALAA